MQGSPCPTPPSWVEADSIRETTLVLLDHRQDRTALRQPRATRERWRLAAGYAHLSAPTNAGAAR